MWLFKLRENVRTSLWFFPALWVTVAIALGLLLPILDRNIDSGWIQQVTFRGDAENARTFLTTIASSMITFTGLVFTITIVVLQLASQQFSPRVLRTFLRDRQSQLALGVFVATFTYAMVVLRGIRSTGGPEGVPNLSITTGFLFALVSLAVFVSYIHHISQSIRVSRIAEAIAHETRATIGRIYDHDVIDKEVDRPRGQPDLVLQSRQPGVVTGLDRDGLVESARDADVVLEVVPAIGDFVPEGAPVVRVYGDGRIDEDNVIRHIAFGPERTMQQDPAFGFRQLVDIAEKALSPSINDPTTAVQAVDEMHDLLRRLVTRPFPSGQRFDDDHKLRLIFPVVSWESYVDLACLELRHYGEHSIQVMRRMRAMLEDLRVIAPSDRLEPIEKELKLLDATVQRNWPDLEDRAEGSVPDEQGLGH